MVKLKKDIKLIVGITVAALTGVGMSAGYVNYIEKRALPEEFTVTAHTGCEGTDDNSLEAIKKGYESGADIVEFDLRFTKSGEPVLSHDKGGKNCVTLKEAFALVAEYENLKVNIDCKTVDNIAVVPEMAEEYGIRDRIFYTGIETDKVAKVQKDSPGVEYYLNTKVSKWRKNNDKYICSLVKLIKDNGAVGINIHFSEASKRMVDIFRQEGLKVSVWTVNKEKDMHKVLELKCDNITSRYPTMLIGIINSK